MKIIFTALNLRNPAYISTGPHDDAFYNSFYANGYVLIREK